MEQDDLPDSFGHEPGGGYITRPDAGPETGRHFKPLTDEGEEAQRDLDATAGSLEADDLGSTADGKGMTAGGTGTEIGARPTGGTEARDMEDRGIDSTSGSNL